MSRIHELHINGDCNGGYGFIPCPVCVDEDTREGGDDQ